MPLLQEMRCVVQFIAQSKLPTFFPLRYCTFYTFFNFFILLESIDMSCQELYCLFLHSDILLFLLLHQVVAAGLASPQDADCDGGDGDNQMAGHLRDDKIISNHAFPLFVEIPNTA